MFANFAARPCHHAQFAPPEKGDTSPTQKSDRHGSQSSLELLITVTSVLSSQKTENIQNLRQ